MISPSSSPDSILPLAVHDAETCQRKHDDLRAEIDRVADGVFWRVFDEVAPCCDDAANGAEGDDPAGGDGSDSGSGAVVETPGEESGACLGY